MSGFDGHLSRKVQCAGIAAYLVEAGSEHASWGRRWKSRLPPKWAQPYAKTLALVLGHPAAGQHSLLDSPISDRQRNRPVANRVADSRQPLVAPSLWLDRDMKVRIPFVCRSVGLELLPLA